MKQTVGNVAISREGSSAGGDNDHDFTTIIILILMMIMTGSEINHSFLFHGVLKILMACRMLKISIARYQIEPEIHSFPTMYIMGG